MAHLFYATCCKDGVFVLNIIHLQLLQTVYPCSSCTESIQLIMKTQCIILFVFINLTCYKNSTLYPSTHSSARVITGDGASYHSATHLSKKTNYFIKQRTCTSHHVFWQRSAVQVLSSLKKASASYFFSNTSSCLKPRTFSFAHSSLWRATENAHLYPTSFVYEMSWRRIPFLSSFISRAYRMRITHSDYLQTTYIYIAHSIFFLIYLIFYIFY